MTEKANPSPNRPAEAFATAGAIAYGGSIDGFIIDGASPTAISQQDSNLNQSNYDSFSQSSSASSLTVSIAGGEAFVFGSWLAIDTTTSVTLAASTSGQTVFIGWNKDSSNDVIIGLDAAFSNSTSDADQRIPLYDFDTDGSGVTNVVDRRQIGKAEQLAALDVADRFNVPVYANSSNAPAESGSTILIDGTGSESFGLYSFDSGAGTYIKNGKSSEEVEDIVASVLTAGSAISLNYDDANDALTINNTGAYSDENARDAIGTALSGGSNVTVTDDDPNDSIIVDTSSLNQEEVEDVVDGLLVGGSNVSLSYDDANNSLTISVPQAGAFVDDDGDTVAELLDTFTGIQLADGVFIEFGSNSDMSQRYDATNDDLRFTDKTSGSDRMALDRTTGDLSIEGTLTEGSTL